MVKLRTARYCNLKLFLIFLVIYGHMIEPWITENKYLMEQYRLIYLVHMPGFSFLSGLFIKNEQACVRQLKRMIPFYILLQGLSVVFGCGRVKVLTPFWHLWYLLSYVFWLCAAGVWFRFANDRRKAMLLLPVSVLCGCTAGHIEALGRMFSLSRTIVFFPYFWLGVLCDSRMDWGRYRRNGLVALAIGVAVLYFAADDLDVTFLYHAGSYGDRENGYWSRLICYLLGVLFGIFLLSWMPDKRYRFTKAGADTLPAYIFHAPLTAVLREYRWGGWLSAAAAVWMLMAFWKLFQWCGMVCGISGSERGGERWRIFRKSMKNTAEDYTSSYYPFLGMKE